MLRRVCVLFLIVGLGIFAIGCPGKDDGDGTGGETNTGGTPADNNGNPAASGGSFRAGVDSGRAADGSDEDK